MPEESITVTISDEADIDWIRAKVRDDEFASEAEALEAGLLLLRKDDAEIEDWIKATVIPRYRRHKGNRLPGIPLGEVLSSLEEHHESRVQQMR